MYLSNQIIILKKTLYRITYGFTLVFLLGLFYSNVPAYAQISATATTIGKSSGLKLPRFVSTHSKPINIRVGPGKKYDIAWVFVKSGVPVEVINEFDTWRKIRDFSGAEGWIHQTLLSNKRTGRINISSDEQISLYEKSMEQSDVLAKIGTDYPLAMKQCDGTWCEIIIQYENDREKQVSLNGYVRQSTIWGVYEQEKFE